MNQPSAARLQCTIAALRHAHVAALQPMAARNIPHRDFTMYAPVVEELEQQGVPSAAWDHWMLIAACHALLALPDHAAYADMILHTFEALLVQHGYLPPMVAQSLDDYLLPSDTWIMPLLHRLVSAALAPESQGLTRQWPQDQRAMERWLTALIAMRVLGMVGNAETIPILLSALKHRDPRAQQAAAEALGELRASAALPVIVELIRQRRAPEVIHALGKLRLAEGTQLLLELLDEQQAEQAIYFGDYTTIVQALIEAVAESGDARAIPHIAPFLDVADPEVNLAAARALRQFGDQRGASLLADEELDLDEESDAIPWPQSLAEMIEHYQNDPAMYPGGKRSIAGRAAQIRDLSRSGTLNDLPLLQWVEQHDFEQTDQGWSIAEAASRAIARIQARHDRWGER